MFRPGIFISLVLLLFVCRPCLGQSYVPEIGRTVNPEMTVLATEARDGYDCSYVEFSVKGIDGRKERVKAYLLVPDGATKSSRHPAVVMLHDHGARFDIGKEKLVRPMVSVLPEGVDDHINRSSQQWADKYFDGIFFADSLAGLGYVVLVADALYWGERSSADAQKWSELSYADPVDLSEIERNLAPKARKDSVKALKNRVYEGQRDVYDSLMRHDVIWAEKILRDDIASVKLLKSLPYVDKKKVGAFGFSMGAHRCWMLAAFCKDVRYGVALSWMTTLDRDAEMTPSDYSMAVMPMREQMDFGDIGKFLAPKPMLFLSGESDPLFPKTKVSEAYIKLRKHYARCPDRLQTEFFDGGHHCGKAVQTRIIEYLHGMIM